MPTGLFGATEINLTKFSGLVEDTDPAELPEDRASACLNVDFAGECILKRKGKTPYAATNTGAFPILGLYAYYPKDGSERILLQSGVSGTYADQGAGFIHDLGMSVAGTDGVDIVPFQDRVYLGNFAGGLYRWLGVLADPAELVQSPIPPVLNTPTVTNLVGQDVADATDWTPSDPDLDANDFAVQGGTVLQILANTTASEGEYLEGVWSTGATLDVSLVNKLGFSLFGFAAGTMLQFGVKDNAGIIQWLDPTVTVEIGNAWELHEVDISSIDPADRDASTGLAIAWVSGPDDGGVYPYSVLVGPIYLVAGFDADTYRYYMTHWDEDRLYESAPSEVGIVTLAVGHRAYSIDLLVAYGGADVSHVRIYRHRDTAAYVKPLLVVEIPNDSVLVTYEDQRSDADLLLDPTAIPLTTQYQIDPPLAKTYAIVSNRMLAGAVIVDAEYRPWSLYLSAYGKPHSFASAQDAADPLAGGFVDLGEKDAIVRIVEVDGAAIIFTERAVWSLSGTGWDNFELKKRASVGLDAREAIAIYGRRLFFLASDGVRALDLSFGADQVFNTWVVSEPIAERLRAIPKAYRKNASMGVDERGRLHLSYTSPGSTVNDAAVVLDLTEDGATDRGEKPTRPGWTAYDNWGFRTFHSLKKGGGDDGELLGGDVAVGRVWWLHRGADGSDLETDNAVAIEWSFLGPAVDVGRGKTVDLVYLGCECDPAPGESLTLSAVLDRGASTQELTASLGAQTTGIVPLQPRLPVSRARYVQWGASGESDVAIRVRSGGVGIYAPKTR